jgi:hypothetical protein
MWQSQLATPPAPHEDTQPGNSGAQQCQAGRLGGVHDGAATAAEGALALKRANSGLPFEVEILRSASRLCTEIN